MTLGRMSYDLRRLRLHGLIERIPKTHRYLLTSFGLRSALLLTRVYARVLRPGEPCADELAPFDPPESDEAHSGERGSCLVEACTTRGAARRLHEHAGRGITCINGGRSSRG
jgi:hypothetical protein